MSPADRARVAAEIIAPGHLEAEQAGYVDTAAPVPRLDMMGGEFCVNATRAFAALLAEEGKLSPESGGLGGIVSVSGMPERLRVRVRRLAAHCFESAVLLDLPQAPPLENVAPGICLVRVPGIAHLVLDAAAPVIAGVDDGAVYCGSVTFTVTDAYLDTVTVDGTAAVSVPSRAAGSTYIIEADSQPHTIVATDRAGNSTQVQITVDDGHTVGTPATCKAPAVCRYCGESFGDPAPGNHGGLLLRVTKVNATSTADGNIEYWYCSGCGRRCRQRDHPWGYHPARHRSAHRGRCEGMETRRQAAGRYLPPGV